MRDDFSHTDLTQLGRDVERVAEPPEFGSLVRRAGRRRRKQVLDVTAPAAVAVSGIGLSVGGIGSANRATDPIDDPSTPSITMGNSA